MMVSNPLNLKYIIRLLKLNFSYIISIILVPLLFITLYYVFNQPILDSILISIILGTLPILIENIIRSKIEESLEEEFIRFALDLSQMLQAGVPLPYALKEISKKDYGALTDHIIRLAARIDWGIKVEDSFRIFANELNNKRIRHVIEMLLDIYRSGGELGSSLDALVTSIIEIKRLTKKRESVIYENILHSYIIFLFFLATSVVIVSFLVPFLNSAISLPGSTINSSSIDFTTLMFHLSIIQSIFSGLALGKMYRNSYRAGVKHMVVFLLLTLIIFKLVIPIIPKGSIISVIPNI